MPNYVYSAFAKDGSSVSGEIQAENDVVALDLIAKRGLTPITLTQGGHAGPWWSRDISLFGSSAKVKTAELERFFTTFSALLLARFPLPRTLGFCEAQTKDRVMKRALRSVLSSVEDGMSLGKAMQNSDNVFPERFISLIATGEFSNKLAEISTSAAALLSSEAKLKRELRAALIYPVILLIMSALVLGLVVFYLAPTLMPVFATAGSEAPTILRFMTSVRGVILSGWPVILSVIAGISVITYALQKPISAALTALLMRLPLSGPYLKRRETLRLCQTLQLMLSSGATLPQSVAAARQGASFAAYQNLLSKTENHITAGGTLSDTLSNSPLIDDMASALIQAGEESDRLEEVLETVVTSLSESTSQTLNQMVRLLTPLLTLIIGVGVGAVILSTISAIMDLNDIAF